MLSDKEIGLAIVKQEGLRIVYLGDELRKDRDVMLAAVKQNGMAL